MQLQFEYKNNDEAIDKSKFLNEEGQLPFDSESKNQMLAMIDDLQSVLDINDEYALKKLEVVLKYELPTFTATRKLVKNWIKNNFSF